MGHIEQFLVNPFGYDVTAVDFNLPALQTAQELFDGNIRNVAGDALKLPFKNKMFDAVISFDFMEHLPSEALAEIVFDEMERVLKPGGPMFHKVTVDGEEGILRDKTHHIIMNAKLWEIWFKKQGWETYKPTHHNVPIWSRSRIGLYPVDGAFYLRGVASR